MMQIASSQFDDFDKDWRAGKPALVWRRVVADLETPVSAFLKLTGDAPYSFLLESVEGGEQLGRWSVIGWNPDTIWKWQSGEVFIGVPGDGEIAFTASPHRSRAEILASLRALVAQHHIANWPEDVPTPAAGLYGALGYAAMGLVENLPDNLPDRLHVPDGLLLRPSCVAIFDSVRRDVTLVSPIWPDMVATAQNGWDIAQHRLDSATAALATPLSLPAMEIPIGDMPPPVSNTGFERFSDMVESAREYIKAGDIFQVVLSHRFSQPCPMPPFAYYRSLRRLNPSPFLFYFHCDDFHLVGSSPEILVRLRGGEVTIRPLAGTRRRGKDAAEDSRLAAELLADEKECAEHLMLLDLGRNDVGRVAKLGSVRVPAQFVIEKYSHVMHISSTVTGLLADGLDAVDALLSGLPAGTVSGAPKIRAMEIIDGLEVDRRGIYGGCVGYFAANGDMDHCIALRTAILKDNILYVQAGAGIVADSNAIAEWEETCAKARALLKAAETA